MSGYEHDHLACSACGAVLGERCYDLLGVGPAALPSQTRDVPHSCRKRRSALKNPAPLRPQPKGRGVVERRADRKVKTQATGWAAIAEIQKQRRRDGG